MHKRSTSVFFVRMKRLIPKVNHFKLLLEQFSRVHSNALKTSPDFLVRILRGMRILKEKGKLHLWLVCFTFTLKLFNIQRKVLSIFAFSNVHYMFVIKLNVKTAKVKTTGLKPATLFKKRLWKRCFSANFAKFLRTPFLQNNFGDCFCLFKDFPS